MPITFSTSLVDKPNNELALPQYCYYIELCPLVQGVDAMATAIWSLRPSSRVKGLERACRRF